MSGYEPDTWQDYKAARETPQDAPEAVRCDCGHLHTYWLVVAGQTRCAGCLNDLDDDALPDSNEGVSTRIRNQFDAERRAA